MTITDRRRFLKGGAALSIGGALQSLGCASPGAQPSGPIGRVVVLGAGFGGATAAKYLRMWSGGAIEVFLVDRGNEFVSCPLSNLVLGGSRNMTDITRGYDGLRAHGVRTMTDEVTGVDLQKKRLKFAHKYADITYDRLVISPGVDFMFDAIEGLTADAQKKVLHAWKAGPDTQSLRRQLEAMRAGGTYVLSIPKAPYRGPAGPYERACQVAHYFKQAKPRSKVIVLDANDDVTANGPLFRTAWKDLYGDIVEYRTSNEVIAVDQRSMTVKTGFGTTKGDVINILPPMCAGDLARMAEVVTSNNRWCPVNWLSMESIAHQGVHVIGDAVLSAPYMQKTGDMANQQGKLVASAIVEMMNGRQPNSAPTLMSASYSFISDREAIHEISYHHYDAGQKTMLPVMGSGGVSAQRSDIEGVYAISWAQNIWSDMLG